MMQFQIRQNPSDEERNRPLGDPPYYDLTGATMTVSVRKEGDNLPCLVGHPATIYDRFRGLVEVDVKNLLEAGEYEMDGKIKYHDGSIHHTGIGRFYV